MLQLRFASPALGAFEVVGAGRSIAPTRSLHHGVCTWPLAGRGPVRPLHAYMMRIAVEISCADPALTGRSHRRNRECRCQAGNCCDCGDDSQNVSLLSRVKGPTRNLMLPQMRLRSQYEKAHCLTFAIQDPLKVRWLSQIDTFLRRFSVESPETLGDF
jgi:hypothetical protein